MAADARRAERLGTNAAVTTMRPGRKAHMTTLEVVFLIWALGQFTGLWQLLLSLFGYWFLGWR